MEYITNAQAIDRVQGRTIVPRAQGRSVEMSLDRVAKTPSAQVLNPWSFTKAAIRRHSPGFFNPSGMSFGSYQRY
jgi:hypothetical protein